MMETWLELELPDKNSSDEYLWIVAGVDSSDVCHCWMCDGVQGKVEREGERKRARVIAMRTGLAKYDVGVERKRQGPQTPRSFLGHSHHTQRNIAILYTNVQPWHGNSKYQMPIFKLYY